MWATISGCRRGRAADRGPDTFPLTQRMREIIANRPKVGLYVFTYVCKHASPARDDRPGRLKVERYPYSKQGWDR